VTQSNEEVLTILREHWAHARHLETQRYIFMGAYATATAGLFGVIGLEKVPLSIVGDIFVGYSAFTLLSLFHTIRWTFAFEMHRQRVNALVRLAQDRSPQPIQGDFSMDIPPFHLIPARFPKQMGYLKS
jgi:hypothetical protein